MAFLHNWFRIAIDEKINFVLHKFENISLIDKQDFLNLIFFEYKNLLLASDKIRKLIQTNNISYYTNLIEDILDSTSVEKFIKEKIWLELSENVYNEPDYQIFKILLNVYLSRANQTEAKQFLKNKINFIEKDYISDFLKEFVNLREDAFLFCQEIRELLRQYEITLYAILIEKVLNGSNESLRQKLWQELIELLDNCSDDDRYILWKEISYLRNSIEYHGNLWNLAPLEYKQNVIKARYCSFFNLFEKFKESNYPNSQYLNPDYRALYQFDNNDTELVKLWMPKNIKSEKIIFEKDRLLSARGAEKLVKYFYENTGNSVEDIAVHQITKKSQDWYKGDIQINNNILLDVKNARKSANSNVYSEFCIPEFKGNRGHDVIIAAVFSPYVRFNENGNILRHIGNNPIYLGELAFQDLSNLIQNFSDDTFQIDLSRGFDPKKYLPPWLFDYNEQFYLNQISFSKQLIVTKYDIPNFDDLKIINESLIYYYAQIFIYANQPLPGSWMQRMQDWTIKFYNLLYRSDGRRLTLPHLYLSILKHFLLMLVEGNLNYHPNQYKFLLGNLSNPLKLYDPLNIINNFCTTLEKLWENREQVNLTNFKIFKFSGQGLLEGKPSSTHHSYTTILAYCGGFTDQRGKCGNSTLIIGKEQNCSICGKLICPHSDCGFCSFNCLGYQQRKQQQQQNKFASIENMI